MYAADRSPFDVHAKSPLDELTDASRALATVSPRLSSAARYHDVLASVHRLLRAAQLSEDAGAPLDDMRVATEDARESCARSSTILAHTQAWPRGYAGDFELIEWLLDAAPGGSPGSEEQLIDQIVLSLPIVEQHRAKVTWQAGIIRRRLSHLSSVRVLSIACGGSRDLLLLETDELARLSVVLNDLDGDALALAESRLRGKVQSLACVEGNALRRATRLRALGPFDAILVGGLLDYVPLRPAQSLLQHAIAMLAPGGVLGVTNIATGNPWRLFLELIAGWPLIHRDRREMEALLERPNAGCEIAPDHTGLTWLGALTRSDRP